MVLSSWVVCLLMTGLRALTRVQGSGLGSGGLEDIFKTVERVAGAELASSSDADRIHGNTLFEDMPSANPRPDGGGGRWHHQEQRPGPFLRLSDAGIESLLGQYAASRQVLPVVSAEHPPVPNWEFHSARIGVNPEEREAEHLIATSDATQGHFLPTVSLGDLQSPQLESGLILQQRIDILKGVRGGIYNEIRVRYDGRAAKEHDSSVFPLQKQLLHEEIGRVIEDMKESRPWLWTLDGQRFLLRKEAPASSVLVRAMVDNYQAFPYRRFLAVWKERTMGSQAWDLLGVVVAPYVMKASNRYRLNKSDYRIVNYAVEGGSAFRVL